MKLLIAGATGLIGQELVRQCREQHIVVNYLTTRKEKIVTESGYFGYYWDPSNLQMDAAALEGVDVIINLAGATVAKRWNKAYKEIILASRVQSAQTLYRALQSGNHGVRQYIGSSGISFYPDSLRVNYQETHQTPSTSFLGQVTVKWEEAGIKMKDLGLEVCLVRTGLVLASEDGALAQMAAPVRRGIGAALGSGDQWQSWIHLKDIAGIYLYLATNNLGGVYNGVAPNPVSNKALTKAIGIALGKKIWLPPVPAFALRLALGEMADLVLEGQKVSCDKICQKGYHFQFDNVSLALQDLLGNDS